MYRFVQLFLLTILLSSHLSGFEFTQFKIYINQETASSSNQLVKIKNDNTNSVKNIKLVADSLENVEIEINPNFISSLEPEEFVSINVTVKNQYKVLFIRKKLTFRILAKNESSEIIDQIKAELNIQPPSYIWILSASIFIIIAIIAFGLVFRKMSS